MRGRHLCWALAIVGVVALTAFLWRRHDPGPLISGKPVEYWLKNLPLESHSALLPAKNPLVEAGPEIVPSLVGAIERSYAVQDFVSRLRNLFPQILHRWLPEPSAPGSVIRQVAAFRLGLF